jgi:hypothetical protein
VIRRNIVVPAAWPVIDAQSGPFAQGTLVMPLQLAGVMLRATRFEAA